MKTALITVINGQDGSFLAELLLPHGYEVHGVERLSINNIGAKIFNSVIERIKQAQ